MNAVVHRALAVAVVAIAASSGQAAEPVDVADYFPSGTLAYAETTNLAELLPQLTGVFKGSVLEDSIPFVHARKDAAKTMADLQGKRDLAGLGLLTSPEMMAEAHKLRGIAVGVTGFTNAGEPDLALVVLTGDSPAAGLAARAFLTMTTALRRVGEVSKVPIFQYRQPQINYDNTGMPILMNDKPAAESPHELTFAYTPGLFVAGTGKQAIAHAIKRFRGEEKTGLAGTASFKNAAARYRQTGVFYFVNVPELVAKMDAADKLRGGMGAPDAYAWFRLLANSKAVTAMAGNLRFRDGGLAATMTATFDPMQKSPLWDFLSGTDVSADWLQYARRPATLAVAVSLPEKTRSATVIGLLNAAVKATGELGRLPGDVVRELEQKYKVPADRLFARTRGVTLVMPAKQELPKDARPVPILILHTEDDAASAAWEEVLPKLIATLAGAPEPAQPSTETIGGTVVYSLPGGGLPWAAPVHFARRGKTIAAGLDRKLVAAAVTADPAAAMAGPDRFAPAISAVLVGAVSPGAVLAAVFEARPTPPSTATNAPRRPRFPRRGNDQAEKQAEEIQKARTDFLAALVALPSTTFSVTRVGNELRIEVFQPKVQTGGLKNAIDTGALWIDKWSGTRNNQQNPFQYGEFPG